VIVVVAAQGCRSSEAASPPRGRTLDDHDHWLAAAAVEAMDGDTSASHLELSASRSASSDDSTRGDALVVVMRDALRKYQDPQVAVADGFSELDPAGASAHRGVVHLVNWPWALEEAVRFNPAKPAALVYRVGADKDGSETRTLLGAMYTAPDGATADALDRRIPIAVARWHRHVDWCTPKRGDDARWTETGRDGRPVFGPSSAITTEEACDSVAGAFRAHVFGWMVHANLFGSDDPGVIWGDLASVKPVGKAVSDSPAVTTPGVMTAVPVASAPVPSAPVPSAPKEKKGVSARGAVAREGAAPVPVANGEPKMVSGSFSSQRVAVSYARYLPRGGNRRHPGILILSATGMASDEVTGAATALARLGYVAEIVNYLDRVSPAVGDTGAARKSYGEWNHAIGDAITDLDADPAVDSAAIGMVGVMQGGRLAVLHAASDPRIKCLVDYFGMFRPEGVTKIERMPATLIIGLRGSRQVPAVAMRMLDARVGALGAPHELQLYQGDGTALSPADVEDAGQRAAAFFEKYLPVR
jgi:dienelactone hydrolase